MLALDVSGDGLFGRGDETNKGDSYLYKHASEGACFVQAACHGGGRAGNAHPAHTFGTSACSAVKSFQRNSQSLIAADF